MCIRDRSHNRVATFEVFVGDGFEQGLAELNLPGFGGRVERHEIDFVCGSGPLHVWVVAGNQQLGRLELLADLGELVGRVGQHHDRRGLGLFGQSLGGDQEPGNGG